MEFLKPKAGDTILDAGCGTGIFTSHILASGANVVGLDLSFPMVDRAARKFRSFSLPFSPIEGNMTALPFKDESFDKAVSITALEFIEDGASAVNELFRITRSGGIVIAATLNSRSSWASRRRKEAESKETIFSKAVFRSPLEMLALTTVLGIVKTAVHFQKDTDPRTAIKTEQAGLRQGLQTGAFVAACWQKP